MGEAFILQKVNNILEDGGCSFKIKDLSELKEFLNNRKNESLEVFDDIKEMFDLLVVGPGMW